MPKNKTCSRGHEYLKAPCPKCYPGHYRKKNDFKIRAKIWIYKGAPSRSGNTTVTQGTWHFITIPKKQSDEIKKRFGTLARGWGSLPVHATVGKTSWKTSIFPDKKAGAYLLPVKADIRKKEKLENEATISLELRIVP